MMKKILHILFVCLFVSAGYASYTYEVYTFVGSKTLNGTESILLDQQGGMPTLSLTDQSSATIKGTSDLSIVSGGIWHISLGNSSHLDMSGGQVHQLDIGNDATAILTGGLIEQIWSYQLVPYTGGGTSGEPYLPHPHITIVYSGNLPIFNSTTHILTGLWGNGDPFSIYLSPVPENNYGYDPAIENIQFQLIPEPITLALLALGGMWLHKRRKL